MTIEIMVNVNDSVEVELTDSGKEVYERYMKMYPGVVKEVVPDFLKIQFHELAFIFGQELFVGNMKAPFFKDNSFALILKD